MGNEASLALGLSDRIMMQQYAIYSPISLHHTVGGPSRERYLTRETAEALVSQFRGHPRMSVILASLPYNGLWAVDFTRSGVDKGSGIARMGEMLGVEPSEMACVGDSYNDLPMLRACGLPIAMGGAPAEIRAAAKLTGPPVEEDGLAAVIDRYILPRVD